MFKPKLIFLFLNVFWMCCCQVLDAVDLEERFKKALPLLTRQIEGLKLLQKTRKLRPDDDKRVGQHLFLFLHSFHNFLLYHWVLLLSPRCWPSVKVVCSQVVSSRWMRRWKMKMVMTMFCWRRRWRQQLCQKQHCACVSRSSGGMYWSFQMKPHFTLAYALDSKGLFAVVFRPIKMKSLSLQFNHYFN